MRRGLAAAVVLVAAAVSATVAHADAPRSKPAALEVDADRAPAGRVGLGFDDGGPIWTYGVSLAASWIDRPIRLERGALGAGAPASDPVRHRESLALGAALAVGDSAVIDVSVRGSHQVGDRLRAAGDPRRLRRAVVHDVRIGGRVRVVGDDARAMFVRADLTAPTGNDLHFAGDEKYTVALRLIGRWVAAHDVVLAGTLGARVHGAEVAIGDRVISDELLAAAGVELPVVRDDVAWLSLTGEVLASIGDDAGKLTGQDPVEARLGAIVRMASDLAVGVHVGAGLDDAIGAPRWRALLTLAWTPRATPEPGPASSDAER